MSHVHFSGLIGLFMRHWILSVNPSVNWSINNLLTGNDWKCFKLALLCRLSSYKGGLFSRFNCIQITMQDNFCSLLKAPQKGGYFCLYCHMNIICRYSIDAHYLKLLTHTCLASFLSKQIFGLFEIGRFTQVLLY